MRVNHDGPWWHNFITVEAAKQGKTVLEVCDKARISYSAFGRWKGNSKKYVAAPRLSMLEKLLYELDFQIVVRKVPKKLL